MLVECTASVGVEGGKVHALSPVPDSHRITPLAGSARRVRDGELADLTSPLDYPPRQSASRAASRSASSGTSCPEWRHIARFSNPADHLD